MPVTIGRGRLWAACVLEDVNVSRVHASIDLRDGYLFVRDETSRNGTWVDGSKVPPNVWTAVGSAKKLHEMRISRWAILFPATLLLCDPRTPPRSGERARSPRDTSTRTPRR
ncbi:FHA domain-containing protein [Pendulispora albinea]|uniref:FHA domain-containing protein n=1 Tax=Pendulispora albinea TaxID=2741071 RepID=A0ABZ2M3V8_9BACT